MAENAHVAGCWIDLLRPITAAEMEGWRFYLALHRDHWRAARHMFRRACQGMESSTNLLHFVSDTGIDDPAIIACLEDVLGDLARETGAIR
jgi:hypothetical protein